MQTFEIIGQIIGIGHEKQLIIISVENNTYRASLKFMCIFIPKLVFVTSTPHTWKANAAQQKCTCRFFMFFLFRLANTVVTHDHHLYAMECLLGVFVFDLCFHLVAREHKYFNTFSCGNWLHPTAVAGLVSKVGGI